MCFVPSDRVAPLSVIWPSNGVLVLTVSGASAPKHGVRPRLIAGVVEALSTANNFVVEASIRGSDGAARAYDKSGEQRESGTARTGLVSDEWHFEQNSPMERNHW